MGLGWVGERGSEDWALEIETGKRAKGDETLLSRVSSVAPPRPEIP